MNWTITKALTIGWKSPWRVNGRQWSIDWDRCFISWWKEINLSWIWVDLPCIAKSSRFCMMMRRAKRMPWELGILTPFSKGFQFKMISENDYCSRTFQLFYPDRFSVIRWRDKRRAILQALRKDICCHYLITNLKTLMFNTEYEELLLTILAEPIIQFSVSFTSVSLRPMVVSHTLRRDSHNALVFLRLASTINL